MDTMAQTFENYLEFTITVLLIGSVISVSRSSEFTAIIPQVYCTSDQHWKHDSSNDRNQQDFI